MRAGEQKIARTQLLRPSAGSSSQRPV